MNCKKIVSIALCLLHLSMIYVSCEENTLSTTVREKGNNTVVISVSDMPTDNKPVDPDNVLYNHPGLLHNEILRCFNRDGILVSGQKLTEDEFVARIADACSRIFRMHKIECSVTEEDITFAIDCLESWKERGIYDIYEPINENNIEIVYKLLDHLAYESGELESEEVESIKSAFKALEAVGIADCDSRIIREITGQYKSRNKSSASYRALDILEHSYDFWSQLALKDKAIEHDDADMTAYAFDPKLKIDPLVIGVILADAIGALLCWNGGPLSVICAALASIAYYIIMGSRP